MTIEIDPEDVPYVMEALIAAERHLSSEAGFCNEVLCYVLPIQRSNYEQ